MSWMLVSSALVMGLLGGAHCVAMCGGVVGVLCSSVPMKGGAKQLRYVLAYNGGRVASYAVAGALAGAVGLVLREVDAVYGLQLGLRLAAGLLLLGAGLYVAGALRRFALLERVGAPLWRRIEPLARKVLPVSSTRGAFGLGMVWGWLPCGLVYAAVAIAVTAGSPQGGAAVMLAFGVGTLPVMIVAGVLAGAVGRGFQRAWVKRGAGVLLACFGVVNLGSVAAQAGWVAVPADAPHECCFGKGS